MTSFSPPTASVDCAKGRTRTLTDFTPKTESLGWYVLNDNVMGGRSEGSFAIERGRLWFAGRTNTNGGGFSSIRTRPTAFDLSSYAGIRLRILGDGRRYTWRLTSTAEYRGRPVSYWATFETLKGEWTTVEIPFTRFVARFRGSLIDAEPLTSARITAMGLMIYDKQDGPFAVRLDSVSAYAESPVSLARYQWRHRVLIVSAPSARDMGFAKTLREIKATSQAFAERDMVLVTLVDDAVSAAGDVALSKEEVACLRAEASISADTFAVRLVGKDGEVKRTSDSTVRLGEIYQQIDAMPMRQAEARRRSAD
ncbi:MAG: CIA30 family protein [Myxococcota bacterium]